MAHDREVAGLRCTQVLAHLSDYLDGELDPQTRAQVEAHVQGCDWCERFGGRFAQTVTRLKQAQAPPAAPQQRAPVIAAVRAASE
jgi:anti-sigma factor RsiW